MATGRHSRGPACPGLLALTALRGTLPQDRGDGVFEYFGTGAPRSSASALRQMFSIGSTRESEPDGGPAHIE